MTTLRRILAGAALAVMASGLASADSIIGYNTSFGVLGTTPADVNYTLNLQKFDSSLGTLNSVKIYFLVREDLSNLLITNTASGTGTFDVNVTTQVTKNFANSATAVDKFGTNSQILEIFDTGIGTNLGSGAVTPGSPITLGGTSVAGACPAGTPQTTCNSVQYAPFAIANTDAAYGLTTGTGFNGLFGVTLTGTSLANYIGSGTFTLSGTTLGQAAVSGNGNNETVGITTTVRVDAEVDYSYTVLAGPPSVPEPATMALMGSALLGLGLLRRKIVK